MCQTVNLKGAGSKPACTANIVINIKEIKLLKIYTGISLDHSGSMQSVANSAMNDYNTVVQSLRESASTNKVDSVLSVVQCGIAEDIFRGGKTINRFSVQNSSIAAVQALTDYPVTGGNTPLFDSVMMLIDAFKRVPDYNNPDVSFLLMIITDGGNNAGSTSGHQLSREIIALQNTDRWTITFRVPRGQKDGLVRLGIHAENILEFDAGDRKAWAASTVTTQAAVSGLFRSKSLGVNATRSFYQTADTSQLSQKEVRSELSNISKKVKIIRVTQADDAKQISQFIEEKTGAKYILGSAFYQLTKKEKLQAQKSIIVWDKLSGEYYTGAEARSLLNLNATGEIKIAPGDTPQFEVFVQSGSVNRKLVAGTKVVVYKDAYPVVTWAGVV